MTADGALPERLTLKPQLQRYWWLGVIFILAMTLAILKIPADMTTPVDGQKVRWLLGSALIVLMVAAVIALRAPVRLDVEGFVDAKGRKHAWKDCSEFEVEETKVGRLVLSDVVTIKADTLKVSIWGSYGMTNAELADLLNSFRARALGLNK